MSSDGEQRFESWLVGDPVLWQPLLDEVAAEMAGDLARRRAEYETARREGAKWVAIWGDYAKEYSLPMPEFCARSMREYYCERCGSRYLCEELTHGRRICICSNRCARDRRRERNQRYGYASINANRTAQRAEDRAGRVCEYCAAPFEAARSTRRFCSDICRVRWHRTKPQAAP